MIAKSFESNLGRIFLLLIVLAATGCNSSTDIAVVAEDVEDVEDAPTTLSADVFYEYDSTNRLTAVRYSNGDVMRYSYDEAGNILTIEMDKAE